MKKFAPLVAAFAATLTLSAGLHAATPTPTHPTVQAHVVKHAAKPLTATAAKSGTAHTTLAPSCCAGGNCCAAGACCAMPGCCKSGGACCDPAKGTCTSACGCLSMTCCH